MAPWLAIGAQALAVVLYRTGVLPPSTREQKPRLVRIAERGA